MRNNSKKNNKNIYLAIKIALFSLIFIFIATHIMKHPYHLDTSMFLHTSYELFSTGELKYFFATRFGSALSFIPFFAIFGEEYSAYSTLLFFTFVALLFYYLWLKKYFNDFVVLVSITLFLFLPSTLILVSHIKEDIISIAYMLISFYIISINNKYKPISIIFFAFAIMSKQISIFFLPFFIFYYLIEIINIKRYQDLFDKKVIYIILKWSFIIIVSILALIAIINYNYFYQQVIQLKSPYMGQFYLRNFTFFDYLSKKGFGDNLYALHMLYILFPILYVSIKTFKDKLLFLGLFVQSILAYFLIVNNTVAGYKSLLWVGLFTIPLIVNIAFIILNKTSFLLGKTVSYIIFIFLFLVVAFNNFLTTYPAIKYRTNYNAVQHFYEKINTIRNLDKNNSILLGMDNSGLARHYTGIKTMTHKTNPDDKEAMEYINKLKQIHNNGTTIYLLPDIYAYDSKKVLERYMSQYFVIKTVYSDIYEDYHSMDVGLHVDDFKKNIKQKRCKTTKVTVIKSKNFILDQYLFNIDCKDKKIKVLYYGIDNMLFRKVHNGKLKKIVSIKK